MIANELIDALRASSLIGGERVIVVDDEAQTSYHLTDVELSVGLVDSHRHLILHIREDIG